MEIQEVIQRLTDFGYPVKEYSGVVEVEIPDPKTQKNKITREEIHAALKYEIPMVNIRQIDPWTLIITF